MRSAAHLEEHLPWKSLVDVCMFPTGRLHPPSCLYSYIYAHTQNPKVLSKSESGGQLPTFIYKEPSAFPAKNCSRSQVM